MPLDDWWLLALVSWSLFSVLVTLLAMSRYNLYKYFNWKVFHFLSTLFDNGVADEEEESPIQEQRPPSQAEPSETKSDDMSTETSEETVKTSSKNCVRIFSYQEAGKIDETNVFPLKVSSSSFSFLSLGSSSTDKTTAESEFQFLPSEKNSKEEWSNASSRSTTADMQLEQTMFIKWYPYIEGQPASEYDLYLDKEESPRSTHGWEIPNPKEKPTRTKSASNFNEVSKNPKSLRMTNSEPAVGALSMPDLNDLDPTSGYVTLQQLQSSNSRFGYSRNRRYIATILHEGLQMKATLYLPLPEDPDSPRYKMRAELLIVLLKSFLWPWENVNIKWVPNLLTWLITIVTADSAVPIFENMLLNNHYKAVLLLSKAAARQIRHRDLVFLFNLALLLQTSPDRVLVMQLLA